MTDGICVYCHQGIAECFACKNLGKIDVNKVTDFNLCLPEYVYKCVKCAKFYHYHCISDCIATKKLKTFTCNAHYCSNCTEPSDKLYKCIKCPSSFHKKCMPKKAKTITGNKILCQKHQSTISRKKEKPQNDETGQNLADKKRNTIKGTKEADITKKKLKQTKLFKKDTEDINVYKRYNITEPSKFDYSASKDVS